MIAVLAKAAGSQYGVMFLIVAVLFGAYKWEGHKLKQAKLELEGVRKSLAVAQVGLEDAQAINQTALNQLAKQANEVERQKTIAAAEAKKSRQRLDAFNALNRKINDAPETQNSPVPDPLESVLDAARLRSSVAGTSGPAPGGLDQSGAGAPTNLDRDGLPGPAESPTQAPGS